MKDQNLLNFKDEKQKKDFRKRFDFYSLGKTPDPSIELFKKSFSLFEEKILQKKRKKEN